MNVPPRLALDLDLVAATGGILAGIAQRMADDVALLDATVTGSGNPWGGDESGGAFAPAYQAILGHAMGALGSYVQQMGDAALSLTLQARSLAEADALAASSLSPSSLGSSSLDPSSLASSSSGSSLLGSSSFDRILES
jgi:hypothetical protein